MRRLEDKVAFMTGAAGGIGSATVRRFVSEGARVAIADIDGARARALAEEIGPATIAFTLDIGDEPAFKAAIDATVAHFGKLDILFNNAALVDAESLQYDSNVVDIPNRVWERTMQVNVNGFLYGCRHAIPHMAAAGGGAIVNMASGAGVAGDHARIAYGTSKAAVIALTKYIATQHGRQRIRCNAIAPGPIVTPNSKAFAKEFAIIARHNPMGEPGKPEDVAALAAYLAADESGYVNGQVITIDGGMSAHHAHVMDMQDHVDAMTARAQTTHPGTA
ncbi:SDR family oxidoreductase [Sphingomonas sp. CGMCC 1.13654]|uniref:SDR family oxidoreductase n=1 Tax=Sphingomonas chungangi TaxID=2683589 RepID=A0A838L3Y6_9SPHN|nr:SDR family oxidoreductase [Sphingomonas chungangi]MBA2933630.1 SDR family oxidoreductase [Sphingomonas chungangi]MVW54963.1 SDR family oxidoreductase [Sphingomonas chungangi]